MKEFLLSGDNCYFQDNSERICKCGEKIYGMRLMLLIIVGKLMRMGFDEILQFFQSELEKNFGYDDDIVID